MAFDNSDRESRPAIAGDRRAENAEPKGAKKIFDLSVKLGSAALIARERGDDVNAIFFAIKAAETLKLAKLLGYGAAEHARKVTASHD